MIVMRWRMAGEDWQEKPFPEDRLQELMDRANAKFGNPAKILDGPYMKVENDTGSPPTPKPRRKR